MPSPGGRKKVLATGCYDWFHTGHVRFTEEVSAYGDLYVVVGNDANIRLLKGEGHPLLSEAERRYVVGSIKYVKQALIASGEGWLDADPEIRRLKPDIYAVNEDGDKGGKREYCESMGIEYLVLKRTPAPGLQPRSSTDLRGFQREIDENIWPRRCRLWRAARIDHSNRSKVRGTRPAGRRRGWPVARRRPSPRCRKGIAPNRRPCRSEDRRDAATGGDC